MAQQSRSVAATPPAHSSQGPAAPGRIMHVCAVGSFRPATEVQRHAPCLCWMLIIRNPTVEFAATFARGVIATEGLVQRARVVRIECDMVLSFVEMRRPSRISPLLEQLEGRSDVMAQPTIYQWFQWATRDFGLESSHRRRHDTTRPNHLPSCRRVMIEVNLCWSRVTLYIWNYKGPSYFIYWQLESLAPEKKQKGTFAMACL